MTPIGTDNGRSTEALEMRTSSVGDSVNGGSHTRCAGVPRPANRFSTQSISVRVDADVPPGDCSDRSVTRPTAAAVNNRGAPGGSDCACRGVSRGADTKAVWKRTTSESAVFKYAAPGELGR